MSDQGHRLSGLAAEEIALLEADGVRLTPEQIIKINWLAGNVETPETRRQLSRGQPVFVGGAVLWPLTIQADYWYSEIGCKLSSPLGRREKWIRTAALAYAMAHGYSDGDELLLDGMQASRAVLKWWRGLKCRASELHVAIAQILAQDQGAELPPDIGAGKPMEIGEFSVLLAAQAGGTPDFWERRCSRSYAFAVMSAIARHNAAEHKSNVMDDDRVRAERALGWYVEKIRRKAKGDNGKS